MKATDQTAQQHSPTLAAYEHAAQDCRDIAQQVGVRNCHADPEWRASEYEAEKRYDEVLKAGRKK